MQSYTAANLENISYIFKKESYSAAHADDVHSVLT